MQKLTLDIDGLCVESFATARTPEPRGTVEAHVATKIQTCQLTCHTCACTVEEC